MKIRKIILENIKHNISSSLIVGSGHSLGLVDTNLPEYISTDQDELDLINRYDITKYIPQASILNILANHVMEHIYPEEIWNVFNNIFFMQKAGGYLVICVPDLLSPNSRHYKGMEEAILFQPKASHFIFFSLESITYLLSKIGYEVIPIYYHNEKGKTIRNNNSYNILDKIKLTKYINRSISGARYELCIAGKKIK